MSDKLNVFEDSELCMLTDEELFVVGGGTQNPHFSSSPNGMNGSGLFDTTIRPGENGKDGKIRGSGLSSAIKIK